MRGDDGRVDIALSSTFDRPTPSCCTSSIRNISGMILQLIGLPMREIVLVRRITCGRSETLWFYNYFLNSFNIQNVKLQYSSLI